MVQIFKKEIDDGLGDKLKADTSIAFCLYPEAIINELITALASTALPSKQIDLFYFESILVSTGWNRNDDVFDKAELWEARNTPINKKINFMHDETDIIGHMVTSRVMDDKNCVIQDNTHINQTPENFNILVGGVLYKLWEKEELQARMNKILAEIGEGKWKVSMECVYPHFDYAVITPNKEHKIIERNDQTSFLSKYLRRYGGSGEYDNYRIGRLLRKLVFSGKGIVDEPANPKSVITSTEYSNFLGSAASIKILNNSEKKKMSDVTYTKQEYDELKVKLEKAEAAAKAEAEKATAREVENLKAELSKLTKSNSDLTNELSVGKEVVKAHESKITTLETELKNTTETLTKANEELAVVAKDALKAKRLSMFNDVDVDSAKAEELVNKFLGASDEMFDELVKAMPKKKAAKEEKKTEEKEVDAAKALKEAKTEPTGSVVPDEKEKATAERVNLAKAWLVNNFNKTAKKGE